MTTLTRTEAIFRSEVSEFYTSNHGWLQTWIYKKLGSASDAADLAQDVFTNILAKDNQQPISAIQEPRAYLTVVAKRILVNYYKRQSLEKVYFEALANLPEAIVLSAEDRLVLIETLYQIDAMLDDLPVKARQAFLLSQLEGLSYAQIAEQLNVNVRTIKRYMAMAFEQCLVFLD